MNLSGRLGMNRFLLITIVLLGAEGLTGDPVTAEPPAGVYFGFTDFSGELILIYSLEQMDVSGDLSAVLPTGEVIDLESMGYRGMGSEDNYRQTAYNFPNLPGYLFRIPDGKITAGETVLLVDTGFLGERTLLTVTGHPPAPLKDDIVAWIEEVSSSPVAESWNLATIEGGISVVMVRFEPGDSTNVACLVLIDGERMVFEEYIGGPMNNITVWRADDGGVFDAANFDVIAAFRTSDGIEIVRTWSGPEGESAAFLEENGQIFREVLGGYRYWAPL